MLVAILLVSQSTASASTRAGKPANASTSARAAAAAGTRIPPGTELRLGDQFQYLQTYLALAGQDQDLPYKVEYAQFESGVPMLLAFRGGAIDAGYVGTTPPIFAQAQGQEIPVIAAWAYPRSPYSLVTAPGADDIEGWSDLKGKRVAYDRGTADEGVVLQALDTAGLRLDDIKTVDVSQGQLAAALQGGSADAAIAYGPFADTYLAANSTAKRVAKATAITDRTALLIATKSALANHAKTAALADYITRMIRAFAYLRAHPDRIVNGYYVKVYGLTPSDADALVKTTGVEEFVLLRGELVKQDRHLADLYFESGAIPRKVDVASGFDRRFNHLVKSEQPG